MFFARVVRRIQRTHSVVYPCLQYQQINTTTRRDRLFGSHFSQSVQSFPVKSFTVKNQDEKNLDYEKPIFDPSVLNTSNSSQNGYSVIPESSSPGLNFKIPFDRGYIANGVSNNSPPNSSPSPYTDSGVLVYKPFGNTTPSFQAAQHRLEIDLLPDRDWNQEFNEVLESPPLQRAEKLRNLENEFIAVASKIGKLIITERNLPLGQRQISPKPMSGLAGGEKYQVKGIFFKFAVDKHQLYGSDENAMKVACHELKAHTALVSCGMMHGLKLGLMTVIDYQGCRLTATSVLPIDDGTLVYGSSDGGNLVVASLDVMNDVMSKCSRVLNLKGHVAGIGVNTKFIYGPCDLEGHLGHDGRLYAIDLARLFPPETPTSSIPGGFLYRLLRPELVRTFPKPLSSDAFTLFGKHDSDTHDAEVRQATEFLHHHVIPEFSKSLNAIPPNSSISVEELLEKLHRSGINIRFLGEVRMHLTHLATRRTILTEICARVLKNELRRRLRELTSTDSNCAKLCATFFNTVFHIEGKMSRLYWHALKPKIIQRFSNALTDTEMRPEYDLRKHVQFDLLFARLQDNLGVQISVALNQLPLNSEHVSKFLVKVKPMYTIPRIEADTAAELARSCKDIQETKRLLALARSKYCTILELKPDDSVVLSNLGIVLAQCASLETDVFQRNLLLAEANERFEASIRVKNDDPHALVMWAEVMVNQTIYTEEAAGDQALIHRAIELCLQAESITKGIGSLVIARASAIQHRAHLVEKWLSHAYQTGYLNYSVEALLSDPALCEYYECDWFRNIIGLVDNAHVQATSHAEAMCIDVC